MSNSQKAANKTAPQAQAADSVPLFFSRPSVMTVERHGKAKMRQNASLAFARPTNSIPLILGEIIEAAKYFPIAFTPGENTVTVAIVGFEKDNYFVDEKGQWLERTYVPAYVRKYPFVFFEVPENGQLALCIDEPLVSFDEEGDGTPLYENGQPTAFTQNALQFCGAYQEQHRITRQLCQELSEMGLLTPQRSDITLASGKELHLSGFQLIDQEKLQKLSDKEVLALHKNGALPFIYYVLQSQSNWKNLLDLANKQQS